MQIDLNGDANKAIYNIRALTYSTFLLTKLQTSLLNYLRTP